MKALRILSLVGPVLVTVALNARAEEPRPMEHPTYHGYPPWGMNAPMRPGYPTWGMDDPMRPGYPMLGMETPEPMPAEVAVSDPQTLSLAEVQPLRRATDLLNAPVQNREATLSGHISDIVLTPDRTRIGFVAVAFNESVGRLYEVPFADLRTTPDGRVLVCDVTRERLDTLPSFAVTKWSTDLKLRRVNQLLGLRVRDVEGESVGRIHDLLVHSEDGKVSEATVGVGGFLGFRERLASITWNTVTIPEHYARLNVTADKVEELAYRKQVYWERLGFKGEPEEQEPVHKDEPRHESPGLHY